MAKILSDKEDVIKKICLGTLVLDITTQAVYVVAELHNGFDLISISSGGMYYGVDYSLHYLEQMIIGDEELSILPKGSRITLEQE